LTDYPASGQAQIAETTLDGERLIVRRVRSLGSDAQGKLFETWQHHALISNRSDTLAVVEAEHRAHAVVELAIRDVKDQALAHFPSGEFAANAAWTVIACLAHNLLRWTELLGLPASTPRRARTHRRRLLALPGRLTRHARTVTLHLPARWP
jgi:Transposase DDE domain group 1